MFEKILFIVAAIATIAGFILDVWKVYKSRKDDEGNKVER